MSALLLLAAAVSPAVDAGERVIIDLTVPQPCAEPEGMASSTEIVVCAQVDSNERFRLRTDTRTAGGKPLPKAEVRLSGNSTVAVETESADMGMARAQRAMVRLKIAF